MTISLPEALTADSAGKYRVSIRLVPGGLSFSGYRPSTDESFFFSPAEFDRSMPYLSAVKELFFANDCLTWSYRSLRVLCVTPQYTLLPAGVCPEEERQAVLAFNFSAPASGCLANSLDGEGADQLLFGMDEELQAFLNRTLSAPEYVHHLLPSLKMWREQSLAFVPEVVFAVQHERLLDLVCYDHGHLRFVNTFAVERAEDAAYYILLMWKHLRLDPQGDQLHIACEPSVRNILVPLLRTYLRNIHPMPIPSEAYLIGLETVKAPMDLISLLVCEL